MQLTFHETTALGFAKKAAEAKEQAGADWFMRSAVTHADKAGLSLEAIQAKAAQVATVEAMPVCSVKAIRRFFAICKTAGVDATSEERTRGALSAFFGLRIESRKQLTTDQWLAAADAIETGRLVF